MRKMKFEIYSLSVFNN